MNTIRFATSAPWWITFPSLLIAGFAVWHFYRRELHGMTGWAGWFLPTLRSLALIMVLLTFFRPAIYRSWVEGQLGRVVFVVDDSLSMELPDEKEVARIEAAQRLLFEGNPSLVARLGKTHDVRVVAGSDGTFQTVWPASLVDGAENALPPKLRGVSASTDLDRLLRQVSGLFGGTVDRGNSGLSDDQHSAIVLLSDGRNHGEANPATFARQLQTLNIPVHSIPLGETREPTDVAVIGVEVPERIYFRNRLRGSLKLKESLSPGEEYRVAVFDGEQVIWDQPLIATESAVRDVPFDIDIEAATQRQGPLARTGEEGIRAGEKQNPAVGMTLRVEVRTDAEESDVANNQREFEFWSITKETRLLVIDGRSRWETRYVKNLFERDPQWKIDITIAGPGAELKQADTKAGDGGVPVRLAELQRYDAIFLGEIPAGMLSDRQLEAIRQFVDHGGGLVIVDGTREHLRGQLETPLGALIPVEYRPLGTLSANQYRLNAAASQKHVVQLDEDPEQSNQIWDELVLPRQVVATSALPGTEVLVHAETDAGSIPWLATRRYGAGRIAYLSGDETWRWRLDVADQYHGRFWNQLMRSVIPPLYPVSSALADLDSGPRSRRAGEQVEIRARLRGADGLPRGDALVDAVFSREGETFATVNLPIADRELGTYSGLSPPLPPGNYQIRLQASGMATDAASVQSQTRVRQATSEETLFQAADPQLLERISALSGGSFLADADPDQLFELVAPLSNGRLVTSKLPLWETFPWFIIIIGLLALELGLRKRVGLT